jgi:predicted transcriptional regulator
VQEYLRGGVPVHWLSKEARYKIIDVLLSTRTVHSLADELGVSRTTIRKYINREMHPSDEVMARVFQIYAPYEEERILKIAIDDLVEAIRMLAESIDREELRKYMLEKLRGVIGEIGKE